MLGAWWSALQGMSPELVWGLFTRGVGVIFVISYLSLLPQTVRTAGSSGGMPLSIRLAKMRNDFPAPQRYFYFPSLLWINHSDRMLALLPVVGLGAACLVVFGGPLSPYALLLCYVVYLTLDLPMGLIFPWDCLMFETALLGLFLPATLPLPELASTAAPVPALAWAYRILLFRVIFGFGKQKFIGSNSKDSAYLRGFLTAQPLPSILGWYAQKAPLWMLRSMLYFMFLVEIPAAFFMLVPGDLSIIACIATILLMIGIIAFGSFGYFSPLTMVVALPLLDNVTPTAWTWSGMFQLNSDLPANLFVLLHTFGALIVFPFNSWVGQTWSLWTIFLRTPGRLLALPFDLLRALHPFRFVHPYGVFPPHTFPAEKGAVIVEVSWDGYVWYECDFNFFASNERSKPVFVAPHHPRGDQAVIYETYGLNPTTMISALAGAWDPNSYSSEPAAAALCQLILEGRGTRFVKCEALDKNPEPPMLARVRTVLLQPASLKELREKGHYWRRRVIGPHTPDQQLDPEFWDYLQPEPEMWHPEAIIWRRRSKLKYLMARARRGEEPNQAVIADAPELTAQHVEMFWRDFIPMISAEERSDWKNLPLSVDRVRKRFSRHEQRVLARLMGRFSVMLEAKLLPLYLYQGLKPKRLPAKTYLHLWMLIQHIIAQGPEVYRAVLDKPETAKDHLSDLTIDNGMYFLCIFRYETMIFDAQKLRLVRAVLGPYGQPDGVLTEGQIKVMGLLQNLFGYFELADRLKDSFRGPQFDRGYPERYPVFEVAESGEVMMESLATNE